jgi:thiamine transport system substrate-binding protein
MVRPNRCLFGILSVFIVVLTACAPTLTPSSASPTVEITAQASDIASQEKRTLKVMTHDSFAISDSVLKVFEEQNNARVLFLKSGDTGTAVNKAILSKDVPLADIFYGIDNTFLSRGLNEGIFESYPSPNLAEIPDEIKLDPQNRALPVDIGDVCLNYDKIFFQNRNLPPPTNLEDLLKPEYKGMLVVENPATSSPGLAFLLTTIAHFGEEGYLEYWHGLVENDLLVVNDWEAAYRVEFSRSGGDRPIVVSYSSSPPFEVIYSEEPITEPPTAAIVSDGACFRQVEFVGILTGTPNRPLAEAWIDFMLSPTFQEDMPFQMFVFPVNRNARLDQAFMDYLMVPDDPAMIAPDEITAHREKWIETWTETVLR